jgi:eukaryotic-like serine/threonine-protein kinase
MPPAPGRPGYEATALISADVPVSPAGIGRPSRPAWQPMESRPAPGGVTVFGTRLTYRQAAIGAGIVLLVLVLVGTLIAQAVGNDGDDNSGAAKPGPTAAPTTAAGAAGPGGSASSAPASSAPASASPSSAKPSAPAGVKLPDGWKTYSDSSGFKVPAPKNVKVSRRGSEVRLSWNNRLLLIDQSNDPKPDAYADWQQQERERAGSAYPSYDKVKLVRVDGYFKDAADWEFYYTTDGGNRQHALKRNIIVNDNQAYSVSWYTSPGDWDAAQADLKLIQQGFQPKK